MTNDLNILGPAHRIEQLRSIISEQPYPLVFVTVSGAHLYGFPSPDSDYDLRGTHILPVSEVVGLREGKQTIEFCGDREDIELDLVSHDLKKFMGLMLRKNGYVLEQLYSPLVLHTSAAHQEMKELGRGCITKHHAYHYLGFAETQWKLFAKENPPRVKPLLYVYRVLLTGIHLMRSGEVEANLVKLNEVFRLPYVPELIQRKLTGAEKGTLDSADMEFHGREYQRLRGMLEEAYRASALPEVPSSAEGLSDLLVRVRMQTVR